MTTARARAAPFVPDRLRAGEHEPTAEPANPRGARAALGGAFGADSR
jgi:hypothetical protein